MRKVNEIKTFNDKEAKVTKTTDELTGLEKVEVLYGARDDMNQPIAPESDQDGHGTWIALVEDGEYYVCYWKRAAYEGGDIEEDDFDKLKQTIDAKKRIIKEAQETQNETNWSVGMGKYKELMNEWKQLPYFRTHFEHKYWEEFQAAQSHFYDALHADREKNKAAKEELIKKAQELENSEEWRKTTKVFKELMDEWKKVGSCGHEEDERLWTQFHEANKTFYDRKKEHWETLQPIYGAAKEKKEALIEQAKAISDSTEWKKTSEEMKGLMDKWREAGFAGQDNDALWEAFNGERQKFYQARQKYFDELDSVHSTNAEAKKKLVDEAERIAHGLDFSRDNTNRMKDLQAQWREIGSAGHRKENELWKKFREAMDLYFDNLRQYGGR